MDAEASLSFDKSDTLTGFLVFAEIENKERTAWLCLGALLNSSNKF